MQVSGSEFGSEPLGHAFVLRVPLARATASRCADCGCDIRAHARQEVTDEQFLSVLNVLDDGVPSDILPGELLVGGYKSVVNISKDGGSSVAVLNCAGKKLHSFLPATRHHFDSLRDAGRLLDVEWEDSEAFKIPLEDVAVALAWAGEHVAAGRPVLINCAQGKSRSGTMATAFIMAKHKVGVDEALCFLRARRPLVEPNPAFVRFLRSFEAEIRGLPGPCAPHER